MNRILARLAIVLAVALGGSLLASPAWADTVSLPLRDAVASLPVAAEDRTGYDRDLFPLWVDADGDGCNARYEVLIAEATTTPTVGSGCSLSGGEWYSYYDGATWTATGRPLIAVTDNVNQSKGDQDPTKWMPALEQCRYVCDWVAVKLRWRLTVDTAEQNALTDLASGCPNDTITVTRAF